MCTSRPVPNASKSSPYQIYSLPTRPDIVEGPILPVPFMSDSLFSLILPHATIAAAKLDCAYTSPFTQYHSKVK